MSEMIYAVYPGSVTLYDGSVKTWTAADLLTAYGLTGKDYIVVNSPSQEPRGEDALNYIPIKPRADDQYQNYADYAQDDGNAVTWGPDFDDTKRYTMESNRENLYPDENDEQKLDDIVQ